MDDISEILKLKDIYCKLTGLAPATVATKVMNDGKFFDRLANGCDCRSKTVKKVKDWFKLNTPKTPNINKG